MKTRLSKFLSMILIAALIMTGFTGFAGNTKASAAEDEIKVFVTIADDTGAQVVKQKTVEVTDVDEDGAYTVYDALYCAHEKYFKGGAADGFAAEDTEYGLSLTKLWGIENGGSYGYMVNDAYAYNLADPVADNDYVNAYCYVDVNTFSDKYTYFTKRVKSVKEGNMIKLKLCTIEWDYMAGVPNAIPYAGAKITVNGIDSGLVTSKKGYVKIPAAACGSYYVSAVTGDDNIIIAPACVVFVQPLKGETIEVKDKKYTVVKNGKVSTGKKGNVTYSKSANKDKKAPKTIEYAGVTYKVKVVG